jgi:hypothetical protein
MKSKKFPFSWEIIKGDGKQYDEITKKSVFTFHFSVFLRIREVSDQTRYP